MIVSNRYDIEQSQFTQRLGEGTAFAIQGVGRHEVIRKRAYVRDVWAMLSLLW